MIYRLLRCLAERGDPTKGTSSERYRLVKLIYPPEAGPEFRRWSVQRPTLSGLGWENVCYCKTREEGEKELADRRRGEIIGVEIVDE